MLPVLRLVALASFAALSGCAEPSPDADQDGYTADVDCDDGAPAVNPNAVEACNLIDDDCDGDIDEEVLPTWYADVDGDQHGNPEAMEQACIRPEAFVDVGDDCDDANAAVNPEADELCTGVDDDCDGEIDESSALDAPTWWEDTDGDGFGNVQAPTRACDVPAGHVANALDCDDVDLAVFPDATEACNGVDDDCDDIVDEEDAIDAPSWFIDLDGDGHGIEGFTAVQCESPPGYAPVDDDCDDTDAAVFPDAPESCDGRDEDCDGEVDEAGSAGEPDWYADVDGDGFGDATAVSTACDAPAGTVADATDCDDAALNVHPGAAERCDGADDDCDGTVDEDDAVDAVEWYADADGDGWGNEAISAYACAAPAGFVADATDCDDADGAVSPGATEVCDNFTDDDCDTTANACAPSGTTGASLASAAWIGAAAGDGAGGAVAGLGDADGDGVGDALIGGSADDTSGADAGAAWFVAGPVAGTSALPTSIGFWGEAAGDSAGSAVAGPGDVDGDGLADALVGAPGADLTGADSGAVYLLLGGVSASRSLGDADARLRGTSAGDRAGASVAGVGDVDADGFADVLVGAPGEGTGGVAAGAAYLMAGPFAGDFDLYNADTWLGGEAAGDEAGSGVAGAGDVDGDGTPDLLVAAPGADGGAGAVYLVLGPAWGEVDLADADARLAGEAAGDGAGSALAGAGDTDGDGYGDVLVGAAEAGSGAGAAYLARGPVLGDLSLATADVRLLGAGGDDGLGSAVSAADLDGDGRADVAVGAAAESTGAAAGGSVWAFYGPLDGALGLGGAGAQWYGDAAEARFGSAIAGIPDADGNGYADILVGAPGWAAGGSGAGAVFFFGGSGL